MLSNSNLLNAQNAYIDQLQKENDDLKAKLVQCADREAELCALRTHNVKLRDEILDAQEQLVIKDRMIATLKQEKENLKGQTVDRFQTIRNAITSAQLSQTEQHLRSAENALKEKDAELEALRAHCGERSERNADQKPAFTPPPARKVVLTSCTLEEREEALKQIKFMEDHITGFLDRMLKH